MGLNFPNRRDCRLSSLCTIWMLFWWVLLNRKYAMASHAMICFTDIPKWKCIYRFWLKQGDCREIFEYSSHWIMKKKNHYLQTLVCWSSSSWKKMKITLDISKGISKEYNHQNHWIVLEVLSRYLMDTSQSQLSM